MCLRFKKCKYPAIYCKSYSMNLLPTSETRPYVALSQTVEDYWESWCCVLHYFPENTLNIF